MLKRNTLVFIIELEKLSSADFTDLKFNTVSNFVKKKIFKLVWKLYLTSLEHLQALEKKKHHFIIQYDSNKHGAKAWKKYFCI